MKDKNTEEEEQDTTVTSTSSIPQQPAKSAKSNLKRPHSSHSDKNSHHDLHSSSKKAKTSKPHVTVGKSTFKVIDCSSPPLNHDKDTASPQSSLLKNKDNGCQEAVSSEADAPNTLATKFQLPSRDSFSYSSSSRVLKCPSCNKFFVNVAELIDHSCYPSPCTLCDLNFKTKSELNNHYERVHNRTKNTPVPIQHNEPEPQVSSAETHIQTSKRNGPPEPENVLSRRKVLSKKMVASVMSSKKAKGSPTRLVSLGKLMKTLKRFEPKGTVGLAIGEISRFRCVRCDHFFINCKQICMHYKNCKLPFNRNRSIKDRNIRWLCLQCHSSFSTRSEVQEHMKITCTTDILKTLFQLPAPSAISSSDKNETSRLNTEPVHDSPSSKQSAVSSVDTSAKKQQVRINASDRKKSVNKAKEQESSKLYCPECGTACLTRRSLLHHGCATKIKYMANCNVYVEQLDFAELRKLIKKDGTIKNVRELMKGKRFSKTYLDLNEDDIKQEVLSDEAPEYFPCARSQFHVNVFATHASRLERLGYFCECRQLFSSLDKFTFHAKNKHGFEITYNHSPHVCAYCFSQFFTPVSLKLHDCEFYRKEFLKERGGTPVSNKPRRTSASKTRTAVSNQPRRTSASKARTVLPVDAGKQACADVQIIRSIAGSASSPCTVSQPRLSASSTGSQPNVDHSTTVITIDDCSVVNENVSSTGSVSSSLAPQEPSLQHESSSEQCSTLESNLRTRSESLPNEEAASTDAACSKPKEVPTSAKEPLGQLRLASILPNLQFGGTSRRLSLQRIEFERQLRAAGVHPHSSLLKEFFEFQDKPSQNLADVQQASGNSIDILPGTPESMVDPPSEPSKESVDTPPLLETCETPECHPNFNPSEERVEFGTFSSPDAWCIEDTSITNCSSETEKLAEKYVCSKCYLTYVDKDSLAAHYNSIHSLGTEGPVRIQIFNKHKETKFSN